MLEHTKTPPTDPAREHIAVLFEGPLAKREQAIAAMQAIGFTAKSEGRPWKEALGYDAQTWPATVLKGGRTREGLTQQQLADLSGIPRTHISDMERNRRPMGKQNARKLAAALNVDPRLFIGV